MGGLGTPPCKSKPKKSHVITESAGRTTSPKSLTKASETLKIGALNVLDAVQVRAKEWRLGTYSKREGWTYLH